MLQPQMKAGASEPGAIPTFGINRKNFTSSKNNKEIRDHASRVGKVV